MQQGLMLFGVGLVLLFCLVEGRGTSFTPTLDNKVNDKNEPHTSQWRERIVSLLHNTTNQGKEKEKGEKNTPYIFPSWIDGPNCPNYQWDTVSAEVVSNNFEVKSALKTITLNAEALIEELSLLNLTLGMSLFVVYNDTVIYENGFGVKDEISKIPPDFDTIYDIGSVTKIFTSALFMKAQAEGRLNLDDDITEFFNDENPPAYKVRNPYKSTTDAQQGKAGVPLHSLAGQVSGTAREAPCGIYCPKAFTEAINFDYLNAYYSTQYPPFSRSQYSNLGFTLLGRATERAIGEKYEDAVVSDILYPLNMTSSGFEFTDEVKNRMATGYTTTSTGPPYLQEVSAYNTQPQHFSAPAGGMYSSPRDLSTFLSYLFHPTPKDGVLGGLNSLWEALAPGENENDGLSGYGLMGWEMFYDLGRNVRTKGGLVDGFATSIAFDPILKLGVGALINFPDGGDMDGQTTSMMTSLIPSVTKAVQSNQKTKPLSPNYKSYEGNYYGVVNMFEGEHFSQGYLDGSIAFFASPVVFWWDPELDYVLNNVTFNAYRFMPTTYVLGQASCIAISEIGAVSVLW
eukprot:CAMPEP_0201516838 /NCGR_PEP_ID=MMETSP0161_2-20130828/8079_1 /ASSEMBLY_ACC=CAM_ASM_000251 /TAXON_ID=180227 /ORGANISM="Neoparamoeba aestuarina, Strain SoJaBio B1-5/56/2" /LENGTH=568 /DNA_ID=CAMNT_0047914125 /DNA_START=91 /DNA_END=1794 /DNA_ORIENTATION=+